MRVVLSPGCCITDNARTNISVSEVLNMHIGSRFVYFNRLEYKNGIDTDLPLLGCF